eukprot:scaffold456599_cov45-Prasinocladus_malaysianus.AAC.1
MPYPCMISVHRITSGNVDGNRRLGDGLTSQSCCRRRAPRSCRSASDPPRGPQACISCSSGPSSVAFFKSQRVISSVIAFGVKVDLAEIPASDSSVTNESPGQDNKEPKTQNATGLPSQCHYMYP